MFFSGHIGDSMDLRKFLTIGMVGSGLFVCMFGMAYFLDIHSMYYFVAVQIMAGCFNQPDGRRLCLWLGIGLGRAKEV